MNGKKSPASTLITWHPTWWWFVGFVAALAVFISFVRLEFVRPAIYNQVGSLSLRVVEQSEDGTRTEKNKFKLGQRIVAQIQYTSAKSNPKVLLIMARLSSDGGTINGREILIQREIALTGAEGSRFYDFPAYENRLGNYEITLQHNGEIVSKTTISLER